ncbi:hypothetical protein [Streptomyces triticiradicis]|uniref:Uncharacterized protein n=1 Tax=Streptomyces triticiradicis TaxID=2651189 RepID=A0A7J5DID4_9ACTN|nr:hypothetical protein [Streptomyces triticiradicis]KAB1988412.1 hypothetical protein F8144_12290 [Streptomyces triticiradicis]
MVGHAVSFLLGLGAGWLFLTVRRHRRTTAELSTALQESVTAFGEELAALELDVSGPDATLAVLDEYRAALEAYDRAGSARTEHDVLTALHDGRAAMIRLGARRHGRPVPIDALPPAAAPGRPRPLTGTGERHVATGHGEGRTEVLIDRPEPGRPALLEFDVTGGGSFDVKTMTNTEDRTHTDEALIWISGEYHGRRYLPVDPTHLLVTTTDHGRDERRWSIRVAPLSAAKALAPEHRGHGDEVLRYDGGPAVLTVQLRTHCARKVRYVCGRCLRFRPDCDCRPPAWPRGTPGDDRFELEFGWGAGHYTLRLPRPGFLVVQDERGGGSWYLTTRPVGIPPPTLLGRLGQLGRRR